MSDTNNRDLLWEAVCEICGITQPSLYGRARLNGEVSKLRHANITAEEVTRFGNWFSQFDWRGKKGELPTPTLICKEWPQFKAWDEMQALKAAPVQPVVEPEVDDEPRTPGDMDPEYLQEQFEEWAYDRRGDVWDSLPLQERQVRLDRERAYLANKVGPAAFARMPMDEINSTVTTNAMFRAAKEKLTLADYLKTIVKAA